MPGTGRRRLWSGGNVIALAIVGLALDAVAAPKIDTRADRYLKQMCSFLAGLRAFSVTAHATHDETLPSGEMVQVGSERSITIRRPNRLVVEASGDMANRKGYYDGKTFTLLDLKGNLYASTNVPGTIDAMLDRLHNQYGISQPLADFVLADPYKALVAKVQTGTYVGEHKVGGTQCHHLAFRQAEIDWQVWIDAGERPLPRKFVIVYKKAVGSPRFSATLDNWVINPTVSDDTFVFQAPAGAVRIEILPSPAPASTRPGSPASGARTR